MATPVKDGAVEEILTANRPEIDISTLKAVQRAILAECPVHGRKYILKPDGHHVSTPGPFEGAKIGGTWQKGKEPTKI